MLLNLPEFNYFSCTTIDEACAFLKDFKDEARVFAGGTDLLVKMKHRTKTPYHLINIKQISGLNHIRYDEGFGLRIGTLATMEDISNSSLIMAKYSALGQAAALLGTPQIRALATLGGNLCNASPAAECAPALLIMGAEARVMSYRGERILPMDAFFTGPGQNALKQDELLTEIRIPEPPSLTRSVHLKFGARKVDVAIAGVSIAITLAEMYCQEVKIALNAVNPVPFRAKEAEKVFKTEFDAISIPELVQKTARTASEESSPISDLRASADYRRQLAAALVDEGLRCLIPAEQ
jgi:carbon-monoxide dehydrogenase medium subunit